MKVTRINGRFEPLDELLVAVREPDADLVEVCLEEDASWVSTGRVFQEACRVPGYPGQGESIPDEHKHEAERCRIVEHFVRFGADPSLVDEKRRSPLLMACRYDLSQVAETLLRLGARADHADASGATALHRCAELGRVGCASVLLAAGAQVNVRNNHGMTPLHRAVVRGHKHMVVLLLAHGADPEILDDVGHRPRDYAKTGTFTRVFRGE